MRHGRKEGAQTQIYGDTVSTYLRFDGELGLFSGTDNITWYNDTGHPDATPEILDSEHRPKKAYYAVTKALMSTLASS